MSADIEIRLLALCDVLALVAARGRRLRLKNGAASPVEFGDLAGEAEEPTSALDAEAS